MDRRANVQSIDGPIAFFQLQLGRLRERGSRHRGYCRVHSRMPDEIWIGAENLSPVDYLATLGSVVEQLLTTGTMPASVDRKSARTTVDRYVADDSTKLWGWIIFPEGFHAPRAVELAQAPGMDPEAGDARSLARHCGPPPLNREPRARDFRYDFSPMHVLITGGAGFLGKALAARLLQRGRLRRTAGTNGLTRSR